MNRTRAAALAVAGALSLAACGSTSTSDTATRTSSASAVSASQNSAAATTAVPEPTSAAPTTSSLPEPTVSARGYTVKQIGEPAYFVDTNANNAVMVELTVDKIEVDPGPCTGYGGSPPDGMHTIAVHMTITTTAALANDPIGNFQPSPNLMHIVGPDGITENGNTPSRGWCLDTDQQLGEPIGPAQKVVGLVELNSRYTTGTLLFQIAGIDGGWEWNF